MQGVASQVAAVAAQNASWPAPEDLKKPFKSKIPRVKIPVPPVGYDAMQ